MRRSRPRRRDRGGSVARTVIEAAPAKINLALHVRRRRTDGYHDLETLFAFTDFGDTLAAAPGEGPSLAVAGDFAAAIGEGDNLVLRAARALADAAGIAADVALRLTKRIPVAAGLGGGSADAGATLRLLNRFWRLGLSLDALASIGASLGADVPACVHGRTMVGTGRGEVLAAVDLSLAGTPCLLVNPRVAVPTGPVFAGWDGIDRGALVPSEWRNERNDLTAPAIAIAPVVAEVLAALEATDATFVRMSGSGATCLALYDDAGSCMAGQRVLAHDHPEWWSEATTLRA